MPQMEKFGYASATTTLTSTVGSSSRTRRAALIPASLPPIATMLRAAIGELLKGCVGAYSPVIVGESR